MTRAQDLVWKLIDQTIEPAEFAELEALLMEDHDLRLYYQDCLETSGLLKKVAAKRAANDRATSLRKRLQKFKSRPISYGLVGVLVGILSTTAVFGYVLPKISLIAPGVVSILSDPFEDISETFNTGFPAYAGSWAFQRNHEVVKPVDLSAVKGEHVLRMHSEEGRRVALAYYLIDLHHYQDTPDSLERSIHIDAAFHSDVEGQSDHYIIRAAAFAEAPEAVAPIWEDQSVLFEKALQHHHRAMNTNPESNGWQKLTTEMHIPRGTRTLVLGFGSGLGGNESGASIHYLDSVSVNLIVSPPAL